METTRVDGVKRTLRRTVWKTATQPFKNITPTSCSPKAFSLYTEERHMGTQAATVTRDHNTVPDDASSFEEPN